MLPPLYRIFIGGARRIVNTHRHLHITQGSFLPLIQFKLSDIGEGIAEVQVKEWYVKIGDKISQFDNICEVQSDKASVMITSRYDEETKEANQEVKKGKISNHSLHFNPEKPLATPAVRRVAIEHDIDLKEVKGTGKDGRILKDDIISFLERTSVEEIQSAEMSKAVAEPKISTALKLAPLTNDKVIPIRGYSRAMIKTMTEALKIPHFGYFDEINMDRLIEFRNKIKETGTKRGLKISYMPMFIKATSLALSEFPILNSVLDDKHENIIYKASHNICIAIDTTDGLVVPNIKNCEQRNLWEIASELNRLQENGKRKQIAKEDLINGTFTLSNVGTLGGTYASPVIFPPQVAVGAIGRVSKIPRFDENGTVCAVHIAKISWSADHRIIDGATMARFSNLVKNYLENPYLMVAELR
ncbi:unnamed protein product [Dracunculus medinensis]|uniref:Dihydrolipoamide acetyltransferase component of pyruvate dehydrogenase complex n=1 Tax=Dracunculus medinensis TaxID=318479 RepID=A0A0N4UFZ4_DRAME|nr:unnamed protein product [Dracunculus medinensis]